jgi:hypothetical protein
VQGRQVDRDAGIICVVLSKTPQNQGEHFFAAPSCQGRDRGCFEDVIFHAVLILGASVSQVEVELRLRLEARDWNRYQLEMRTGYTSDGDNKGRRSYAWRLGCDSRSRLDLELELLAGLDTCGMQIYNI